MKERKSQKGRRDLIVNGIYTENLNGFKRLYLKNIEKKIKLIYTFNYETD